MANLPRCYACDKILGFRAKCTVYPDGIPKNILTQVDDCSQYVKQPTEIEDDGLPVGKGR